MQIKFDVNGNRVLSLDKNDLAGARGFSVQTLGHLPKTHRDGIGPWTDGELRAYVREFGTPRQKEIFGI
jgi:hypothetical protein